MIAAMVDRLWQSTLSAAAVAILAVVFRNARAAVRYGLWFAASVKFLVPFAVLAGLGRLLAAAIHPPAAPAAVFIARAAQPFAQLPSAQAAAPAAHATITSHAGAAPDLTPVFLGVWALGFAIVLVFWMARWARIRPLVRQATPVALAAPMPVLATPSMMEPGLVGLWRPVLLVPQALFDHLDRPAIEALVAHEACHYRRGDNLTAAIHMLVEALFWFHPMVWWIGGRLVQERERACDEAVVRAGHDPAVYAESLLECCRLFLQSPLRCVAGASGSNLSRRVETIMSLPLQSSLSRSGKAVLIAAAISALASPVAAGWLIAPAEPQALPRVAAPAPSPASALAVETQAAQPGAISPRHARRRALGGAVAAKPAGLSVTETAAISLQDVTLVQLQTTPSHDGAAASTTEQAPETATPGPATGQLAGQHRKQRICWAGRYGCAPERNRRPTDSTFPDYQYEDRASPGPTPGWSDWLNAQVQSLQQAR